MALSLNQYGQTVIAGQMDMQVPGTVISVAVNSTQATPLVPGQAVKIVDSAGGIPKVVALAANTDQTYGFVSYNIKDSSFAAGEILELAQDNSVIYLTSGAAIARGAALEVVAATSKVITSAGTNPVIGRAMDKATATDQLIRVKLAVPTIKQP